MEIEQLLTKGVDPNTVDQGGRTAMHWAAQAGYEKIVRILARFGADVDVVNDLGFTPLAIAAGEGHDKVVLELLEAGASASIRNKLSGNFTPLHLASSWGRLKVVKCLVEVGKVDVNARDDDGVTPLAFAEDGNFSELSAYLRKHGGVT